MYVHFQQRQLSLYEKESLTSHEDKLSLTLYSFKILEVSSLGIVP